MGVLGSLFSFAGRWGAEAGRGMGNMGRGFVHAATGNKAGMGSVLSTFGGGGVLAGGRVLGGTAGLVAGGATRTVGKGAKLLFGTPERALAVTGVGAIAASKKLFEARQAEVEGIKRNEFKANPPKTAYGSQMRAIQEDLDYKRAGMNDMNFRGYGGSSGVPFNPALRSKFSKRLENSANGGLVFAMNNLRRG